MKRTRDNGGVGSIWRQKVLGSPAAYELVEDLGDIVVMAVREAPGLEPGTRVRFRREALRKMERVAEPDRASAPSSRVARVRRLPASEH